MKYNEIISSIQLVFLLQLDNPAVYIYEREFIASIKISVLVTIALIRIRQGGGLLHNSTAQFNDFGHKNADSGNCCIKCNLKMTNALPAQFTRWDLFI